MKILVKIVNVPNPEFDVSIGIKHQYKEFDYIEDAFEWIFKNQKQIESYKIFEINEFSTKNDNSLLNKSKRIKITSDSSYGTFE